MARTFEYRCVSCGYIVEMSSQEFVPPSELVSTHFAPVTNDQPTHQCANATLKRVWGNIAIFNLVPDFSR